MAAHSHDQEFAASKFGLIAGQPLKRGREQNTGICWKYVSHWGVRELFREIVQNLIDAVNDSVKSIGTGLSAEHINLTCTNGSTDFEWTVVPGVGKAPVQLGFIKYDENSMQLTLSNRGRIPMEGLLMGGGVKAGAEPDPNIAGRFGEGLKLAVLCALREKKTITIKTGNGDGSSLWSFGMRWDPFFSQHCVFFQIDDEKNHDPVWTTVVIGGVTRAEWVSNSRENQGVHAFLALREQLGENLGAIVSHNPRLGTLLLGPDVRGCLFVKGIFVNRPMHGKMPYEFGYNFTEMALDRDRNTTIDRNQLIESTSALIVDVLRNRHALAERYPAAAQFDVMIDSVYKTLEFDSWETLNIHLKWGGKHPVCSALIDRWRLLKNHEPHVMPIHSTTDLYKQRMEFGLSSDFYITDYVSSRQQANFCLGASFESLPEKMERLSHQELYPAGLEHPSFLQAMTIWQRIQPDFKKESVCFTNLAFHQNYTLKNVIYFSRHILDDHAVQDVDGPGTSSVKKLVSLLAVFRAVPVTRLFGLF